MIPSPDHDKNGLLIIIGAGLVFLYACYMKKRRCLS